MGVGAAWGRGEGGVTTIQAIAGCILPVLVGRHLNRQASMQKYSKIDRLSNRKEAKYSGCRTERQLNRQAVKQTGS